MSIAVFSMLLAVAVPAFILANSAFHGGIFAWLGVFLSSRYHLGEVGIGPIHKAVTAFCEATVSPATGNARSGCLFSAAALRHSERVTEIRSWLANGFTANAEVFAKRFEKEMKAGRVPRTPSGKVRGRLLADLLQGVQLRAKSVSLARNC